MKNQEITSTLIRKYIKGNGIRVYYNKLTETIKITNSDGEIISNINQWILDCFPHYLPNIYYSENCLEIIGIRK